MIDTSEALFVLSVLTFLIFVSTYLAKTRIGKQVGAALIVIILAAICANLGIIPSASNSIELYDGIFHYVAPISIFYLLLQVNLKSIREAGIPMIGLFVLGSLATAVGILLSWWLINPQEVIGEEAKVIAGMLTGTYTGGSVNFNAIALEFDFQDKGVLYAGTIAVDNVITTIWIVATLSFPVIMKRWWRGKIKENNKENHEVKVEKNEQAINLQSFVWLAFLGVSVYYISEQLASMTGIPSILLLTTFGIILAQFKFVTKLKGSHDLGLYLVYLFLAVIGAYCELAAVAELQSIGVSLLMFAGLAVFLHGILLIVFGGILYRDWDMIGIVSQANVGGGATAIALAETFGRKELVLPAVLVGTLGNALGTYLGFLVIYVL